MHKLAELSNMLHKSLLDQFPDMKKVRPFLRFYTSKLHNLL